MSDLIEGETNLKPKIQSLLFQRNLKRVSKPWTNQTDDRFILPLTLK